MSRITAWVATTVTLVSLTADAQRPGRSVQSSLRDERGFATELQRALRMGDRDAVAGMLRYPARVSVRRRPYPIFVKDRAALVDMYDLVFTPHLRCAIVESREPADREPRPKYSLLLARGVVSLADGRIIAERLRGTYQITRMASFGDTSTRLGRPRPVTFAAGQRQVELGGRVAEAGADAYVVVARAGARLQAAIRGFPAGSLSLRVSRRGSETFLDGADQVGSSLTARLNEGGEYLVEVVRRAPYCEPPVIGHLLTLSLTAQCTTGNWRGRSQPPPSPSVFASVAIVFLISTLDRLTGSGESGVRRNGPLREPLPRPSFSAPSATPSRTAPV